MANKAHQDLEAYLVTEEIREKLESVSEARKVNVENEAKQANQEFEDHQDSQDCQEPKEMESNFPISSESW